MEFAQINQNIRESLLDDILKENINIMELSQNFVEFRNQNLDSLLIKIISVCEKCLERIDNFLQPKGIKNILMNYFMNDAFGSIYEMKYRLINEFKCTEEYLLTHDKYRLET